MSLWVSREIFMGAFFRPRAWHPEKGSFPPEVLQEKVLSAIVEFKIPFRQLQQVLALLKKLLPGLDTVASVSLIGCSEKGSRVPLEEFLIESKISFYPNGKVNIGLGRPLAEI
jgi:hypothetical protein